MTSLTIHRLWTSPTIGHAMLIRQLMWWVDVINVAAAVLRPVVVSVAVITAAATWTPPAHADPLSASITDGSHNTGHSSCAARAPYRARLATGPVRPTGTLLTWCEGDRIT
jgi:hypothetical protein